MPSAEGIFSLYSILVYTKENSTSTLRLNLLKIILFLVVFWLLIPAHAQQEETDKAQQDGNQEAEVIVVTAQKRKQSIQKVPLAISAFDNEDLLDFRLQNISDIANLTPGFAVGQFNLGQPQLYIRGIGSNEDGAGGDNSVIVFIDGVYIGRASASMFDFYDVERIEVLRGPQGTLYGKNAVGGAINVITHQADAIESQQLHFSVGQDNLVQLQSLNATDFSDSVSGKVALLKTRQDGYVHSRNGFDLNDKNDFGIRAEILHESESAVKSRFSVDWLEQKQSGAARHPSGGALGDDVLPAIDPEAAADPFTSFADVRGFQHKEILGATLSNQWQSDLGEFTLINSWRQHKFAFLNDDLAISPEEFFLDIVNGASEKATQHSHELRWQQQFNALDWLTDLYALFEDVERGEYFSANIIPTGTSQQQADSRSYALYSHLIYPVATDWELSVGARYTSERKSVQQQGSAGFVISETYDIDNSASWQHFTPKVALSYQLQSSQSVYISASRGFKSGGFQGQAPTAAAAETPFNEETATNYELGYKTSFAGGKLWLNSALFHTDYQDLQILELMQQEGQEIGVLVTQNAAEATTKGFELELSTRPLDGLQVLASYAYLDARYTDFYRNQQDSRTGNRLRNAPKHSAAIRLQYTHTLSDRLNLNWRYSHSYQDKRYQEPENMDSAAIPAHDVANFNLDLEANDQSWRVSFWVDNLWNETYLLHNFPIGTITNPATPAPPRRYGVTISYWY